MSLALTTLVGVYDAAGSDRFWSRELSAYIGRSFSYIGSDGQRHRGTVRAICHGRELWDGMIAVFSVGYSDGHWVPLDRVAVRMEWPLTMPVPS